MKNKFVQSIVLLSGLWCSLVAIKATAAPVETDQRIPVDVRRTTLLVRDIDKSLPLYRDALGMKVVYDQQIGDSLGSNIPPTIRLVLLRANDNYVGLLGLMQRLDDHTSPPPELRKPRAGNPIVVINASDLEERFERVRSTPGVTVETPPTRIEYPSPGGTSIPVLFSAIYDPDGFFIEVNKLLGAPAGTQASGNENNKP